MRIILILVVVVCLSVGSSPTASAAYYSESISKLRENAHLATRAESLQGLQEHARTIMALADDFQKEAQEVNDHGFVNEAVDIYNSAYRASKSSSLEEARSYAREIVYHAEIVAEQSGFSHHTPYSEQEPQEENWGEDGSAYGYNLQ